MWQPNQKPTSLPKLFLVLGGVSVSAIALVILLADIKCNYDIEGWWAQPYPGAKTIDIQYDLFRPRALAKPAGSWRPRTMKKPCASSIRT